MRTRLVLLILSILGLSWAQKEVVDSGTLTTGLKTSLLVDRPPCAYRINWVEWDSPFRGQAQPADLVVAVDGQTIPCIGYTEDAAKVKANEDLRRELTQRGLGGSSEHLVWRERGLKEGSPVVLSVLRRGKDRGMEKLELRGSLKGQRIAYAADGRPTLGLNGPVKNANDGLNQAWGIWYENFVRTAERVLGRGTIQTQLMLRELLQDQPRLEMLGKKYPGPFAKAVQEDWDKVRKILEGNEYKISAKDLEYRQSSDRLVAQIAEQSKKAREAFVQQLSKDTIKAFPTIDPIKGDPSKVTGKVVVLETIPLSNWVYEGGICHLTAGSAQQGFYFIGCASSNTQRMIGARFRYLSKVSPKIDESFAIVGRITGTPKMLVINNKATTGLEVEALAATIGDKVFVDLTAKQGTISQFVGEADLNTPVGMPAKDASPLDVMNALINALKLGNETTWKALFASWTVDRNGKGQIQYRPNLTYGGSSMGEYWVRSRRFILNNLYDVRVVYISEVETLLTGKEFAGAPVIEQVTVEVDHVGKFGEQYRSFADNEVHRVWKLQRIDGGPWRITTIQGI